MTISDSASDKAADAPSANGTTLLVLCHPDDEYFLLPHIHREIIEGRRLCVIYTTDGGAYGHSVTERSHESLRVLECYGVNADSVYFVGMEHAVPDGKSYLQLKELWGYITEIVSKLNVRRIFVPAWEGGHQDHDAAHLLGIGLSKRFWPQAEIFEYPIYNGYRIRPPFFRVMTVIPSKEKVIIEKIEMKEALQWFMQFLKFKTQRRTFLGLSPFCFYHMLIKRAVIYRPIPPHDYRRPPHEGPLLYESRFGVAFEEFQRGVEGFMNDYLSCLE